jgi:hypothetical protein
MADSHTFQIIQLTKKDVAIFRELITLFKIVFEDPEKQNPSLRSKMIG